MPQRSSDIVEQYAARALAAGVGGAVLILLSVPLFIFRGEGALLGLASVLLLGGIGLVVYAITQYAQTRKVSSVSVTCPFCQHRNSLTATPEKDFTCDDCHRLIPIDNGQPMSVSQVRCGYCNTLNFYSDKTEVLVCEDCNREIPISKGDDFVSTKKVMYARQDDTNLYELVLVSHDGHHTEGLIGALQHMLALNRNQVKQMLDETPVTLLTGIPKMKAEILTAQLKTHGATAEFRQL